MHARAHAGFCHANLTNAVTMQASDGSYFTHVTCGCQPAGQAVNVPDFLVNECAEAGAGLDECSHRLANRPRGGPQALLTAARHMTAEARLTGLPDGWGNP